MFKKILVPSDGSPLAHRAGQVAAELAQSQGAQVVGVFVIDPFPYIGVGDAAVMGLQAYLSEAKNLAGQSLGDLQKVCAERGVPFAGDTIERSSVHEGILETAEAEACDLIVMGSHGRSSVQALVLGDVAHQVAKRARAPVMIVKAEPAAN